MLLHKVAFVLALKVDAPADGIFELHTFCDSLFEDLDAFSVGKPYEAVLEDTLQALDELLVEHIVEELDVVGAMVEGILNAVFDELLCEVHIVFDVIERHLGLDHPEFGEVPRGVGVLCSECRAEGVNLTERQSAQLTFELTADSEGSLAAEKSEE